MKHPGMVPITVTPIATGIKTRNSLSQMGKWRRAERGGEEADTFKPTDVDGGLSFADIRGPESAGHYAYEMSLSPELHLRQPDPQHIEVFYWKYAVTSFVITESRHDVIGTAVRRISASAAREDTLTVGHRGVSPVGGGFIYPVMAVPAGRAAIKCSTLNFGNLRRQLRMGKKKKNGRRRRVCQRIDQLSYRHHHGVWFRHIIIIVEMEPKRRRARVGRGSSSANATGTLATLLWKKNSNTQASEPAGRQGQKSQTFGTGKAGLMSTRIAIVTPRRAGASHRWGVSVDGGILMGMGSVRKAR